VQFIGALSIFWPLLLGIYIVVLSLLLLFILKDRGTLLTADRISINLNYPKQIALNDQISLTLEAHIKCKDPKKLVGISIKSVSHNNLDVFLTQLTRIQELNNSSTFHFTLNSKASRVGEIEISKVMLEVQSENRLLSRTIEFNLQNIKIVVSPPIEVIPEALFQTLTKNQKILKQGITLIKKSRAAERFHSLRDYRYPDPIKHIDHKKSAKFGSLKTRTFESLHAHHLILCLDVGRAMFGMVGESRKIDYYLSACMQLSKFAIDQGDYVSFLAFSQKPHSVVSRAKRFEPIWETLKEPKILNPHEEASDYSLIQKTMKLNSTSRSIVILLSDTSHPYVQDSLYSVIKNISRKHLVASLSLLERKYEINSKIANFNENEHSVNTVAEFLYTYWLNDLINSYSQKIDHVGAGAIIVPDQYWMSSTTKVYSRLRESSFA
jgi:uncharacterized protein (DUF58 family)